MGAPVGNSKDSMFDCGCFCFFYCLRATLLLRQFMVNFYVGLIIYRLCLNIVSSLLEAFHLVLIVYTNVKEKQVVR